MGIIKCIKSIIKILLLNFITINPNIIILIKKPSICGRSIFHFSENIVLVLTIKGIKMYKVFSKKKIIECRKIQSKTENYP